MNTKSLLLGAALLFFFTVSNAQNAALFNGAWRSVDDKGFSVMHDGYFNAVGQDSTGKL